MFLCPTNLWNKLIDDIDQRNINLNEEEENGQAIFDMVNIEGLYT